MSREFTGPLSPMSSGKNGRRGQERVWRVTDAEPDRKQINVQLPTGYGKTLTYCRSFAILQAQGRADHLLIIFPFDAQLDQFLTNAPGGDLRDGGVRGSRVVVDIRFFQANALQEQARGARIFVVTIQSLIKSNARLIVEGLMAHGTWMVVVDEYHHYGEEFAWGKAVAKLPRAFLFACSATPTRPGDDSAFGPPDEVVTYREAEEEGAVMPLIGHSYVYKLDAVLENGDIESYTTTELIAAAGGDAPGAIEALRIRRKMRWSPKYISPLVSLPLGRIVADKVRTGLPLQALVGAMCVSHAKIICGQIRDMFPELRIDWVGTGEDGRSPDENAAVIKRFSPPKDQDGQRPWPSLDVLVQVGIFGEGGDSPWIVEVISARSPKINNTELQFFGRGARIIPGHPRLVTHVNFDSSSEFAEEGYIGRALMDAMDGAPPRPDPEDGEERNGLLDLPERPDVDVVNVELLRIDRGDPGVERMMEAIGQARQQTVDPNDPDDWALVKRFYHKLREEEAARFNQQSLIEQWSDKVEQAVSTCVSNTIRLLFAKDQRFDKTIRGDLKKRINTRKRRVLGEKAPDLALLQRHYAWCVELNGTLKTSGIPAWLG